MLKYNVIARKNPINKSVKFHAKLTSPNVIRFQQLATSISEKCTVTIHDVKAVLSALEQEIVNNLRNGATVRLGDLGTFHATLSTTGVTNREDFTAKNINRVNVRFLASSNMRHKLSVVNPEVEFMKAGDIYGQMGPVEEE